MADQLLSCALTPSARIQSLFPHSELPLGREGSYTVLFHPLTVAILRGRRGRSKEVEKESVSTGDPRKLNSEGVRRGREEGVGLE